MSNRDVQLCVHALLNCLTIYIVIFFFQHSLNVLTTKDLIVTIINAFIQIINVIIVIINVIVINIIIVINVIIIITNINTLITACYVIPTSLYFSFFWDYFALSLLCTEEPCQQVSTLWDNVGVKTLPSKNLLYLC